MEASFTYNGNTISYQLLGFSRNQFSTNPEFSPSRTLVYQDLDSASDTVVLYAIWRKKCIVVFNGGLRDDVIGNMEIMTVDVGQEIVLPECGYDIDDSLPEFTFHKDTRDSKFWVDVDTSGVDIQ